MYTAEKGREKIYEGGEECRNTSQGAVRCTDLGN